MKQLNKDTTANSRYKIFGYLAKFKDGFVLGKLVIMEKSRIFNPKHLVAARR
ncbi:hypothetical protein HNP99_002088 [Flavobacterium sp. 28A]|nr:hypothetical protein [Flavobacterium sp. 28A]